MDEKAYLYLDANNKGPLGRRSSGCIETAAARSWEDLGQWNPVGEWNAASTATRSKGCFRRFSCVASIFVLSMWCHLQLKLRLGARETQREKEIESSHLKSEDVKLLRQLEDLRICLRSSFDFEVVQLQTDMLVLEQKMDPAIVWGFVR